MNDLKVVEVKPRLLAAVRRKVQLGGVAAAFGPPLGLVWTFLRANPELRTDGHNVFIYHPPARPEDALEVDFGVEVTSPFEPDGEVRCVSTPGGRVVTAVHRGPYHLMSATYDTLDAYCAAHGLVHAGVSWEIYGDPTPDPAHTETTLVRLLA